MEWITRGKIFDPSDHEILGGNCTFAQSPQTLVFDNFIRIYFSTRKLDPRNGKYLSHVAFVDFNKSFDKVLRVSQDPVIELGALGTFDEHGIFPINPVRHNGKIFAYTCGWSRRVSVSVETSVGLATSHDNGETFQRYGDGPIFSSSLYEPMLVGDAFVRNYDGIFHMWYIFGERWKEKTDVEPPARIYKIAHGVSNDGVNWRRDGHKIVLDRLNSEECQALPTVVKIDDVWHMIFCYREATDFRSNPARGYRLGHCISTDLVKWTRCDEMLESSLLPGTWDKAMMCYPHLFQCDGRTFLLYNGNDFGRDGFGLAELLSI